MLSLPSPRSLKLCFRAIYAHSSRKQVPLMAHNRDLRSTTTPPETRSLSRGRHLLRPYNFNYFARKCSEDRTRSGKVAALAQQPFEEFTEPTPLGSRESLLTVPIATPLINGATDKLFEPLTREQLEFEEFKRQRDREIAEMEAIVARYEEEQEAKRRSRDRHQTRRGRNSRDQDYSDDSQSDYSSYNSSDRRPIYRRRHTTRRNSRIDRIIRAIPLENHDIVPDDTKETKDHQNEDRNDVIDVIQPQVHMIHHTNHRIEVTNEVPNKIFDSPLNHQSHLGLKTICSQPLIINGQINVIWHRSQHNGFNLIKPQCHNIAPYQQCNQCGTHPMFNQLHQRNKLTIHIQPLRVSRQIFNRRLHPRNLA